MSLSASDKSKVSADVLKRTFNDAAVRYKNAFPVTLKNLFISLGDEKLYVSPEVAQQLTLNVAGVKKILDVRNKWMKDNNAPAAAGVAVVTMGLPVRHVSFDAEAVPYLYTSWNLPLRLNFITLLDHEIGHLVVKKAAVSASGVSAHTKECAADAYAALRHFQRFGNKTGFTDFAPATLAQQVTLLDSKHHYTSAVVLAVIDMYRQSPGKIRKMSLTETAELADELAFTHALTYDVLRKVETAFAPARAVFAEEKRDWKKVISTIVDILRANADDADICKAGVLTLKREDLWALTSDADKAFVTEIDKFSPRTQAPFQTAKTQISPR